MELIVERLISLRKSKGDLQHDVADALGVRRATYGAYERGVIMPSAEKLVKIADYFNTTAEYLMGKTEDPSPISTVFDVQNALEQIVTCLCNDEVVTFAGRQLDTRSRELLVSSLIAVRNVGAALKGEDNEKG